MIERGITSNGERGSPEDSDDNPPPNNGLNRIDDFISEASNSSDYLKTEKNTSNSTVSYPGSEAGSYFSEIRNSYTIKSIGAYNSEPHRISKRLEFDEEEMTMTLIDETFEGDVEIGFDIDRPLYECPGFYEGHR